MKTLSELLGKPFMDFQGKGKVKFKDDKEFDVSYTIQMLWNGKIVGNLDFHQVDFKSIHAYEEEMRRFNLEGIITSDNNKPITAENCILTGATFSIGTTTSLKARFESRKVLVDPDATKKKPQNEMIIQFGVANMEETLRVIVDSEMGKIWLRHYQGIEDMVKLMRLNDASLITSCPEIVYKPDGTQELGAIVERAIEIMRDFLKITSLSETSWHEWVFVRAYEKPKPDSDKYEQLFLQLRSPKTKPPSSRGLTNPAHSATFIGTAWKGFKKELDEKYSFDLALEYYIESNSATVIESRYLMATTCFEMLMDRFHTQMKTEFMLEEDLFNEFYEELRSFSSEWLKAQSVDAPVRASIYRSLKGINRRSYVEKAARLLEHWGVSYSDTGISLEDIVKIRNDITHRGKHEAGDAQQSLDTMLKVYEGLFAILTRIFLSMLNYEGQYYDPTKGSFIDFVTVCTRNKKSSNSSTA